MFEVRMIPPAVRAQLPVGLLRECSAGAVPAGVDGRIDLSVIGVG